MADEPENQIGNGTEGAAATPPVEVPVSEIKQPIPPAATTGGTPEGLSDLKDTVRLVIIVLLVGLVACVIAVIFGFGAWYATYTAEKQASYDDLTKQVEIQEIQISNLTQGLQKAHIIR